MPAFSAQLDDSDLKFIGPILGGVITERSSWRWIYLFNAPAAAVGIMVMLLCWPRQFRTYKKPDISWQSLRQVDWLGAILLLAASTLLVFAFQEGGSTAYAWNSATIVSTLTISGICWVAFFSWIAWLSFGNGGQLRSIFPLHIALTRPIGPAILYVDPFKHFESILLILQKPRTANRLSLLRRSHKSASALSDSQRKLPYHGWCTSITPSMLYSTW